MTDSLAGFFTSLVNVNSTHIMCLLRKKSSGGGKQMQPRLQKR